MKIVPQSYTAYINKIEDSNWYSCIYAAMKAGFTKNEAESCENGQLNCPICPWKKFIRIKGGKKKNGR